MNRQKYYELLDRVRTHGDWETWLEFFLTGVKETAQQGADTSREILALIEKDRHKSKSLAAPQHLFCAFTSTFNANPSSRFPQQPNNSPSLLPLWRRLCSTWSSSAWSARPPANSAIAFSHIIATWKSSTRDRNCRKRAVDVKAVTRIYRLCSASWYTVLDL